MTTLVLTDELIQEFKKPFGTLYRDFESMLRALDEMKPAKIIAVGDVVTASLLESGRTPDLCIIDGKTIRSKSVGEIKTGFQEIKVENPAGQITEELRNAVKKSVNAGNIKIFVVGEEDLAVLPVVEFAPLRSAVLYGQPNEGVVLVEVSREKKKEIKRYYKMMRISPKKNL